MSFTSKPEIYLSLCVFLLWLEPGSSKIVESCSDGCPVYQMNGVILPFGNIDYSISVWQEGALEILIYPGNSEFLIAPEEGAWYNITTTREDDQYWVSAPGLLPKKISTKSTKLILNTKFGVKNLWKFNCGSAACGCRHFRLYALFLDLEALPATLYWWPGEEGVRLKANEWRMSVGDRYNITSPRNKNKWHDITVDRSPEGTSAAVRSTSLNVSFENILLTSEFSFGGVNLINLVNRVQPSYFALGCEEAPQGAPNDTSFWHPKVSDVGTQNNTYVYVVAIVIPILLFAVAALVVFFVMKTRSSKRGSQPPGSRPDDTRPDAEDNEYWEIDMVALRLQLAKEERQRAKRDMLERVSTESRESENSLYWENTKGNGK